MSDHLFSLKPVEHSTDKQSLRLREPSYGQRTYNKSRCCAAPT